MASGDLTTLDNVKAWLGLDQTTDDVLLTRLISAASGFIQKWCCRSFASQDYTEVRDGTGTRRLAFANYPVTAVTGLVIDGRPIPASAGFGQPGYVFADIMLTLHGFVFERGLSNVAIAYTAGYASIPLDLEQAAIELISLRYREIGRIGIASKSQAGETTSFITRDMPSSVATALAKYQKVIPA